MLEPPGMTVLEVGNLAFGYGADQLFQGVTFSLEAGERAALVAPNGAGKSTLLRLCARELAPDAGTVVVRRDVRLAYARQSHELLPEGTVLDAFLSAFSEVLALRHALTEAQHAAASGTDAALARMATLTDQYHLKGGDELERRVTMIAQHLGFSDADLERPLASLSGGERGRLHLGTALAQEPDLLLLDEPTNHLDLDTIAWLERHLADLSSAMLVVSHDRAFLDNVCPNTMELGRRSFRVYPLKYSDYAVARAEDLARERELVERQQETIAKTEDFIRKNIAGQKTKQAQSRRKMLDKMDTLERPEDVWATAEKVSFRFAPAPRSGDIVLEATGLGASRGGRRLFSGIDLLVRRGERIGVVGPNGAGKTTLLKLLAGVGAPEDQGTVRRGTNLHQGYFDQHLGSLDPARTAVEEIRSVRGDLNADGARQYLARFRFWGDDPLRRVSGFSGGERSRLALAKLLLEPRNLLFLDEPTNHLDIPAAEILEEALAGFEGTAVLVSHDRRFLEGVTTRVILVRDGEVEIYPGGFRDYEDTLARRAAAAERAEKAPASEPRARAAARTSEPPPRPRGEAERLDPTSDRHRDPRRPRCCHGQGRGARPGGQAARVRGREGRGARAGTKEEALEGAGDGDCRRRDGAGAPPRGAQAGSRRQLGQARRSGQAGAGARPARGDRDERVDDPLRRARGCRLRRAARKLWAALAVLALLVASTLAITACSHKKTDDGTTPTTDHALPPLKVDDGTPDLMLTWIDDKGESHVELRPQDVPAAGRALVRVVVSDRDDGTHDLFYVADLNARGDDGAYATRTMRRREWESEIEKRREAYLAKTAPRPATTGTPAEGGHPAMPGQQQGGVAVIIYGASWCGPCHQAADFLKARGVPYVMKDVEETPGAAAEMREKLARVGHRGGSIPVIDVRGQILIGFSASSIEQALAKSSSGTTL